MPTSSVLSVLARWRWVPLGTAMVLAATCGCSSMNNTDKGVLTGAGLGAGAGALIGAATHHAALGALAGGALGGVAGGLTGNAIDKSEAKTQAQIAAANAPPPFTIQNVVELTQQHTSDAIIISQIRTTGSVYYLQPQDIEYLKANGVSDVVVMEMQATANRLPRRVYTAAPVYGQAVYQPVYVAPPPPPVGIGIGVGYVGHR